METFEREVLERLKTIEVKIDGYSNVKAKVYENERRIISAEDELEDLVKILQEQKEDNRWLKRTLTGAIITSVVSIVFIWLRIGMGI